MRRLWQAPENLDLGGVTVSEVPALRLGYMRCGGLKRSGWSREGPHWAIQEMTQPRLLVLSLRQGGAAGGRRGSSMTPGAGCCR